jgi:sortase (surface protein transpeptidase)
VAGRPSKAVKPEPEVAAARPLTEPPPSLGSVWGTFRRRILPWIAAPLAIIAVFGFGAGIVYVPPIPRVVTSSVGPTLGSIGEPVRLLIPSIDVDAPVVPIEMDRKTRVLSPPADVKEVGWWTRSSQPGARSGQSLITGHSVRLGDGVMDRLGDVRRGATVQVLAAKKGDAKAKVASYLVERVFVYTREQVAAHSEDLFGQGHHPRRLVLVTCTDWDGQEYRSNIIVYAQPA